MSYELMSEKPGVAFESGSGAWSFLLMLAKAYGWNSKGTKRPKGIGLKILFWDGNYETNDGQLVTSKDAAALADTLEKSLQSDNLMSKVSEVNDQHTEAVCSYLKNSFSEQKLEEVRRKLRINFDDSMIEHTNDLISFCRQGGFRIH